jgi:hypothetical protein
MSKGIPADPAWGRTKAQRSLGDYNNPNPVPNRASRSAEFEYYGTRNVDNGFYSGPRPSFGRYQVSEQAQDILNRQLRTYNK